MTDIRELLHDFDDPVCWEFPKGHDRTAAIRNFVSFVNDLESRLAHRLETESGAHIQDASFFAQVFFEGGALRFSNFGNMIAFTPDHEVPDSIASVVGELAMQRGYLLVPTELLETPYNGANPGVTGISTWWIRYFDYV